MISGDCGGVHRYLAELVTKSERYDGAEGIAEVKEQDPAGRSELVCTYVGKLERVQMVCDRWLELFQNQPQHGAIFFTPKRIVHPKMKIRSDGLLAHGLYGLVYYTYEY